jgi:hypothetical protein
VPSARDGLRNLVAWKLTSLAGLRALSHLNLELVRVREVVGRHTEATRRDLFDGGAHRIAVREHMGAFGVLTTLTGVRLAAEPVHGDSERRVRLHRNGPVRHRTGDEAANNFVPRLDLVDRYGRRALVSELEHAAKVDALSLTVGVIRVRLERFAVFLLNGVLKVCDSRRVVDVRLAVVAPVVLAGLRHAGWRYRLA